MKYSLLKIAALSALIACSGLALAVSLVPLNTLLPNAAVTVQQQLPNRSFALPGQLPAPAKDQHYYLYVDTAQDQYTLDFDKTADCHGAKYCNAGSLSAINHGNPEIYYNAANQPLTRLTHLNGNVPAFYTPAHAVADYWPAMLEWRSGSTLYRLRWQGDINKATLSEIAESVQNFPSKE